MDGHDEPGFDSRRVKVGGLRGEIWHDNGIDDVRIHGKGRPHETASART